MNCPFCGHEDSKVIDTRSADDGMAIRRRRECLSCDKRFTTYEKVEHLPIMVIKKDGTNQLFQREKLMNGLLRACEKTPVSIQQIDHLIDEVEASIYNSLTREIKSQQIGELVMEKLKSLDEVAYVRFASVYRHFKDVHSFIDELEQLLDTKKCE